MSDTAPTEQDLVNAAAHRALAAVRLGRPEVGDDVTPDDLGDHAPEAVPDLITDLLHLLRLAGADVNGAIEQATRCFHDEAHGTVVVLIDNGYACGHMSSTRVVLLAPEPGDDLETWWAEAVFGLTGDPHECDSIRENASCEVRIVDAPGRPDLLDQAHGWNG